MCGDFDVRCVVEDVRLEHQFVVGVGFDQDDVDVWIVFFLVFGYFV